MKLLSLHGVIIIIRHHSQDKYTIFLYFTNDSLITFIYWINHKERLLLGTKTCLIFKSLILLFVSLSVNNQYINTDVWQETASMVCLVTYPIQWDKIAVIGHREVTMTVY
jgi:hypothetical protein